MDPRVLTPNNKNPRKHPKRQKDAYRAFVATLSDSNKVLAFPIWNKRTGNLVDGHMRTEIAIEDGETAILVRVIDCSPEEESRILQYFDTVGDLANIDRDAYRTLLESNKKKIEALKGKTKEVLKTLNGNLLEFTKGKGNFIPNAQPKEDKGTEEKKKKVESTVYTPPSENAYVTDTIINNSALFDADNEWGIPNLQPDQLLADPKIIPKQIWNRRNGSDDRRGMYYCESSRPYNFSQESSGGILGFYTEDFRFEKVYKTADIYSEVLMQENWDAVITPDFSVYWDWPLALKIFNIYRSRWCGRLWQELTEPQMIIPTIQDTGSERWNELLVVDTLPNPTPIVAMQMRKAENRKKKDFTPYLDLASMLQSKKATEHVILYGGKPFEKYIHADVPNGMTFHYLSQYIVERRKNGV